MAAPSGKEKQVMGLERMTEEEKKETARKIVQGEYYPLDTKEKLELCIQLLVVGGLFANMSEEDMKEIAIVLGDMKSRAARTINGLPMFFAVKLVHVDDWPDIADLYNKTIAALV